MTLQPFSPGKWLGFILCSCLISGCATTPQLYHWGSYENQVYAHLSTSSSPEAQIGEMEKILHTRSTDKPVPPGFHAHLGLLYGQVGKTDKMREQLVIEKQLFPESTAFMDFLLNKSNPEKGRAK